MIIQNLKKRNKNVIYTIIFLSTILFIYLSYLLSKKTISITLNKLVCYNISYVNINISDMLELVMTGTFIYIVMLSIPILLILLYMKYKDGLYNNEKKTFKLLILLYPYSIVGMFVGYIISIKYIMPFFLEYNKMFGMNDIIVVVNIIKLIWTTSISFAILIQLPVLLLVLKKNNIITKTKMKQYRPFALILSLIIGAIISPPDGLSMIIFAAPIYIMYELSILI